jgi:importin subunit beta-1
LHRSVKPQILSTFGDIALAIGGHFKKYLEHVLNTLNQACRAQVANSDYDMIDYLNELRESCLSAYTGIIQGLRNSVTPNSTVLLELQLVTAQLPFLVQFIETIAADPNKSDSIIGAAIGLIGDLVTSYGQNILQFVERDSFEKLLTEGKRSKTMKTKTLATWAIKEIRKIKNAST